MHWTCPADGPGGAGEPAAGPPEVPGYRVERVLGRGAGGPVWRARPVAGGEAVAVKLVAAGPAADRELAVLRTVRHPFVVPLLDAVVLDDGVLALVLALVDGGTLRSLVAARGHLTPGEVVTVLSPLARTLADLHALGVEHGDVAPGNVLLDRSGRPFLSDLGTVRITGTGRDEVFGTAGYVDPVVLAGGDPTPASDVYGLGAVGWFALAGAPPPATPMRPRLAELVPAAPRALLDAVEDAVDPDPARRPAPLDLARAVHGACRPAPLWRSRAGPDDGDLTRRLRAACAGTDLDGEAGGDGVVGSHVRGGVGRDPTSGGARHRRERRLRPWLLAAGVLACGTVATLLAVLLGPPHPPPTEGPPGARGAAVSAGVRTTAGRAVAAVRGGPGATGPGSASAEPSRVPTAAPAPPGDAAAAAGPLGTVEPRGQPGAGDPRRAGPYGDLRRAGPYGDLRRPGVARRVVRDLLVRRVAELREGRPDGAGTTAASSSAAAVDAAARRSLLAAGLTYRRLRLVPREVSVRSASGTRAVVRLAVDSSGYDVVDGAGRVRARVPPRSGTPALVHLVLTERGWRVAWVRAP